MNIAVKKKPFDSWQGIQLLLAPEIRHDAMKMLDDRLQEATLGTEFLKGKIAAVARPVTYLVKCQGGNPLLGCKLQKCVDKLFR